MPKASVFLYMDLQLLIGIGLANFPFQVLEDEFCETEDTDAVAEKS